MKKLLYWNILLIALLAFACNDDDDHDPDHEPEIEFLEPRNEDVVGDPSDVHVHIRITAEDEVHDVEIKMHPEDDASDLIIDFDGHSHESSLDFEEDYDLSSYDSGTEFHLEVRVAKDHEGSEFVEEDIHFSIP